MFKDSFWGLTGFEELRKYVKGGNEFCKEVATIMQERADLEMGFAKALSKLSGKLTKASTSCLGTLAAAWSMVATEMEAEAELHRSFGQALHDDIYKPLKNLSETQSKTRKPAEAMVDKALKSLMDKRENEQRCKKTAFSVSKEREKNWEILNNSKRGRGKNATDKEVVKLEKKVRQLDEGARRADRDYHDACQKAESARQEWEGSVYKGAQQLQALEEERIGQMQDFMNKYNSHLSVVGPKLVKGCERMGEAVISVDVTADIRTVIDQKGTGPNQPEQLLCDYYAEDFSNQMDKERRRQGLQNYLLYLQQDIEREIKGKEGVEKLMEVYHNRPNFADADAQEDARQRLAHVNAMLNFLEACHYKISCSVCQLEGRVEPHSKFKQYIERNKDKTGSMVSVLRLPSSMTFDSYSGPDTGAAAYRAPADGGHVESYGGTISNRQTSLQRQSGVTYSSIRDEEVDPTHTRFAIPPAQSPGKPNGAAPAPTAAAEPVYAVLNKRRTKSQSSKDSVRSSVSSARSSTGSVRSVVDSFKRESIKSKAPEPPSMQPRTTDTQNSDVKKTKAKRSESFMQRMFKGSRGKGRAPPPPDRAAEPPVSGSDDDDEFDTFDQSPTVIGQCRAIYDYAASQYDELTIKPGDIINIYDKQEDGWWQGELGGRIGIFPATYVEEFR